MSDLNYNIAPVNPMQGYMSALQTGAMIGGLRDEREKARAQAEADRLAAQQKAEKDAQLAEAYNIVKQAPTADNYAALSNLLPPEQAKSVRESFTMLDEDKQAALLSDSANVFAAFSSNQPELGIKILEERAAAYRNEGNENGVKETQRFIDLANSGEMGQQAVKDIFGTVISMMPKGKDAIDAVAKFHEDRRAEEMHPLNKAKLQAEIDRLNAERDPAQKLSESSSKLVNDAVVKAIESGKAAEQYDNLAAAYDALKPPSGWGAKGFEELKKVVGGQDILTALKQEYVKLRNTEALKNLPPGVASDKDIEVAMSAFPDETSNPELISSFMRGTAKLQRYTEQVEKAKAAWINQNGSLASARKDFVANGVPVTEGTAFWDFTDAIEIPNIVKVGGPKKTASTTAAKAPAAPAKVVEVDY
jgi:hypothetical protein